MLPHSDVTSILLHFIVLLHLASSSNSLNYFQKDTHITQMAQILQHINKEVFLQRTTTLSITTKTQTKMAKYFFNDLTDELLQSLSELKIKISYSEEFNDYEYYNLLLIDSYDSFR